MSNDTNNSFCDLDSSNQDSNTNIIEINNLYNMIKSLQISGKIGPEGPREKILTLCQMFISYFI